MNNLGGYYNKIGNRYELKWTVLSILQVLNEERDDITLEPIGEEGTGCEFTLTRGEVSEYHQVKRQNSNNYWSLSLLNKEGVLETAYRKTQSMHKEFYFISTLSSGRLTELTDRARSAKSYEKFEALYLNSNQELKKEWEKLVKYWRSRLASGNLDRVHEKVYNSIKNIFIRVNDERTLQESINNKIKALIREDVDTVYPILMNYIQENVQQKITTEKILTYLRNKQISLTDYSRDTNVTDAVQRLNQKHRSFFQPLSDNLLIKRTVVDEIIKILTSNQRKNSVVLTGEAGVGKTFALGQILNRIEKQNIPHLYFRIDQLNPTPSLEKIGEQLDLPDSPLAILNGISRGCTALLIIDQLDAVSTISGRNPDFFNSIRNLIDEARLYPHIRLLIACRKFDIEKDGRFRELIGEKGTAQEKTVEKFTIEEVNSILGQLKVHTLADGQKEILRLPYNTKLFADIVKRDSQFTLTREQELFDRYWDEKKREIAGNDDANWNKFLDTLLSIMTKEETLSIPSAKVDDYTTLKKRAVSSNLFIEEGKKVAFAHEKLFDYAVARRFTAKGTELIPFLKEHRERLFHRSLLRQVLLYWYYNEMKEDFIANVKAILDDGTIRFHLRKCVIDLFSQLDQFDDSMWKLLSRYIDALQYKDHFNGLYTFPGRSETSFFNYINSQGVLETWLLSDNPNLLNRAVFLCNNQLSMHCDEIYDLVKRIPEDHPNIKSILRFTLIPKTLLHHRGFFEIFLKVYDSGLMRYEKNYTSEFVLYGIEKTHPEWGLEFIGLLLKKCKENTNWGWEADKLFPHSHFIEVFILKITADSPAPQVIDTLLPFFTYAVKKTALPIDDAGETRDRLWLHRIYGDSVYRWTGAFFLALERVVQRLAEYHPEEFREVFNKVSPLGYYDSINFILLRGLAKLNETETDLMERAADYLVKNPVRLECGWSGGGGGDFAYWATYEAVQRIAKNCSKEKYAKLEEIIINHKSWYERKNEGRSSRGYFHHMILAALPEERLSKSAIRKKQEVDRKYPNPIQKPNKISVGAVGSPLPKRAIEKMTDEQWLEAIKKHNQDFIGANLTGGAAELSRDLEKRVKEEPERFVRLALRFEGDINDSYFDHVYMGIKEGRCPKKLVFDLIRHFFSLPGKPGGRWLSWVLKNYQHETLPDDILQIVGWYATKAEDPRGDSLTIYGLDDPTPQKVPRNYEDSAINCVRGSAAELVGELIFVDWEKGRFFLPFIETMIDDESTAVRVSVAYALLALYNYDFNKSLELFLKMCSTSHDVFLGTRHCNRYIFYACQKKPERFRELFERMLDSEIEEVREEAAQNILIARFGHQKIDDLFQRCFADDNILLKGLAQTARNHLKHPDVSIHQLSHEVILKCFNSGSKEVRKIAGEIFYNIKGRDLEKYKEIAETYIDSDAFEDDTFRFMNALKDSTSDDLTKIILKTCERINEINSSQGGDYFTRSNGVPELLFRVYRSAAHEQELEEKCLNLIDKYLENNDHNMRSEMENFERL